MVLPLAHIGRTMVRTGSCLVLDVHREQGDVEGEDRLGVVEGDVEDLLDAGELLVVGGAGHVGGGRGGGLVAAVFAVVAQGVEQAAAVGGVAGQQRAEFPVGEGGDAVVVGQQVQQAAQADVVEA